MKFVRHLTLVLLASAILGVAVTAASGRPEAGEAASGRIAYSYRFWPPEDSDNYEIFVMDVGTGSDENPHSIRGAVRRGQPRVVAKRPLDRVRV